MPMQGTQVNTSELAILSRVLEPDKPTFPAAAARAILGFDFNQADKARMRDLSAKAQEGTLTRSEQAELDNFERVGHVVNLMQSKARRSLKPVAARTERRKLVEHPNTGKVVPLFNPRRHKWHVHFRWDRPVLIG